MTRKEAICELKYIDERMIEYTEGHSAISMAIEALTESVADDTTRLGREYIAQDIVNKDGFIIGHHCRENIVRCKDCLFSQHDITHSYCEMNRHKCYDDDFCRWAERRRP